jgi:glutamate--cysteine ligase
VDFIKSGAKPRSEFVFGLEVEHLIVDKTSSRAVPYFGEGGVWQVLEALSNQMPGVRKVYSGKHLLGLVGEKVEVSLEPGSQLECSVGPFANPDESTQFYRQFRSVLDEVLHSFNAEALTIGYQPVSLKDEIELIPKERYAAMNEYLAKTGKYGLNMMRASASTQVSIDFESEEDAIAKLRLASLLGPLFCYKFTNTPYFEGEPNQYRLLRVQMWDDSDSLRASVIPHLFNDGYNFESYAKYALSTPLMVVDYSHTPEFLGVKQVQATRSSAQELYPDRVLNEFEITHILSTYFFDCRLKNFVELRTCDSLPSDLILEYMHSVNDLFYNEKSFKAMQEKLAGRGEQDIKNAKREIEELGDEAICYGQSVKEWLDVL